MTVDVVVDVDVDVGVDIDVETPKESRFGSYVRLLFVVCCLLYVVCCLWWWWESEHAMIGKIQYAITERREGGGEREEGTTKVEEERLWIDSGSPKKKGWGLFCGRHGSVMRGHWGS